MAIAATSKIGISRESRDLANNSVDAELNFFKDNADGSSPAPWVFDKEETFHRPHNTHLVHINDVRGEENKYNLDKNGFQFHNHKATEREFLDDDQIRGSYYPEVEQLLKTITNASRVFIFDHNIRRPHSNANISTGVRSQPVQRVHIDQSDQASLSRVSQYFPEEAKELLQGRVQIINVWRPIKTVHRDPLAAADAKSVTDEDLVPIGLVYADRKGETLHVRYNAEQKWFYKSHMTPEDVLLIKCFDSKKDGRATRVPHTAFTDPTAPLDAPERESIEIRALVFHGDDQGSLL